MSDEKQPVKPVHLPADMIDGIKESELKKPQWMRKTVAVRVTELVQSGLKAEKTKTA